MASLITVHTRVAGPRPAAPNDAPLIFDTLRVGFPSAHVCVTYGPGAAAPSERRARKAGCEIRRVPATPREYTFVSDVIMHPDHRGTMVIVDPMVVFWGTCEEWRFDRLIAGRLVPAFLDEATGYINAPRLHPSFWWIPDVAALRERILGDYRRGGLGCLDAFVPHTFRDCVSGAWHRLDTGAGLYGALKEEVFGFTERELDCFDCWLPGSDVEAPAGAARPPGRAGRAAEARRSRDLKRIKGMWKAQDEYFQSRAVPSAEHLVFGH